MVIRICAIAALAAFFFLAQVCANANANPRAISVLDTEKRWLHAIADRDPNALSAILSEHFVHITYKGALRYREDELAGVKVPKPYEQRTGEQTVDFAGNTAIVHGVNTVLMSGRVVLRLRYTDVYTEQNGKWVALSAQETAIAK